MLVLPILSTLVVHISLHTMLLWETYRDTEGPVTAMLWKWCYGRCVLVSVLASTPAATLYQRCFIGYNVHSVSWELLPLALIMTYYSDGHQHLKQVQESILVAWLLLYIRIDDPSRYVSFSKKVIIAVFPRLQLVKFLTILLKRWESEHINS